MSKLKGKLKARKREQKRKIQQLKKQRYANQYLSMIRKFNDPVLSKKCDPVNKNTNLSFIDNMKKALHYTKNGVGLAAPQIGETKRVIIYQADPEVSKMTVMLNPKIVEFSDTKISGKEGCLSYPGIYIKIPRYSWVKVEYLDEKFNKLTKTIYKFEARVVQHEVDHLDGTCLVKDAWLEDLK
jgi:peptide deformylase